MSNRAFVTPKILQWARESARMNIGDAASKLSISPEKLKSWEDGLAQPTIKQAKKLAYSYKRPFALFFLPEVPNDFQPLKDFRKKGSIPLGTGSIFIIREIQQKQSWISEFYSQSKNEKIPFVGKFSLDNNPADVANDILETLNIDPLNYEIDSPIKEWITKSERNGVFVSRTSFIHSRLLLDTRELQGFAISDDFAPYIFINSKDWSAAQLFTLVHELAHIWINSTGISAEVENGFFDSRRQFPVERFCNEVAANALIPNKFLKTLDSGLLKNGRNLFNFSKQLGVSSFAFIVRILKKNLITKEMYTSLKEEADIEFHLYIRKQEELKAKQQLRERKGGPNPYLLKLNKNSRLFTQNVLDAYYGGSIEPNEASSLLTVPSNKFYKLEEFLV